MSETQLPAFTSSDISVVIPSYNSQSTIDLCLQSLYDQNEKPLEVIVVDSSTDETRETIRTKYPWVKLIELSIKTFPGPARNFGAEIAAGKIIGFIDADCIARQDWCLRVAEDHSQGHMVVGGSIDVGNLVNQTAWAGHLMEFKEFSTSGQAGKVLHIPSCNLSYRRELFLRMGGYPNSYYPQEDLLLNYLLNKHGIEVWFDPQINVKHFCREGVGNYLSHQHRIGRVTRCVLNKINLPGSYISQRPWMVPFLLPFISAVKFFRTSVALLRSHTKEAFRMPGIFVLLAGGIVWWARGFYSGTWAGLSGIVGWDDPNEPIFDMLASISDQAT